MAMDQAVPGVGEDEADVARLKKFGKLLATFGARMSCLLRHLGPECPPPSRREAHVLFAQVRRGGSGGKHGTHPISGAFV